MGCLMNAATLGRQISFLREIEKLKSVTRANKTLDGRNENSAEHSWHVALMALLLEEHARSQLDMLKVTRMLLIHDIVEIDAGDTWIFAEDQSSKLETEKRAANRLFALLPVNQQDEYLNLWCEFEDRLTEEAKFAAVIDGIQPLLNHLLTGSAEDGVIAATKVRDKKAYIREYAPNLWDLVNELIVESESRGLYD
jgi:putative hydrolase of HD superfamily